MVSISVSDLYHSCSKDYPSVAELYRSNDTMSYSLDEYTHKRVFELVVHRSLLDGDLKTRQES